MARPANSRSRGAKTRKATLTWDDPADSTIVKYQVSTDGGFNYTDIIGSSAVTTTHIVTGLTNGTAYTLALRAANDFARGAAATITATPLWPAPENLTATPANEAVVLEWDRNSEITHYRVNTQSGGAVLQSSDLPLSGMGQKTNTIITGLTNGTEYTFTVQAVDTSGNATVISGRPSSATATPALVPAAPTGLTATQGDDREATLTWTDPHDSAIIGYQVSIGGGVNYTDIVGSSWTTTTHIVTA